MSTNAPREIPDSLKRKDKNDPLTNNDALDNWYGTIDKQFNILTNIAIAIFLVLIIILAVLVTKLL